jgi:hypothetical protein
MRSRFSDGVVIVLLGFAILTAAVHALPAPPDMSTASVSRQSMHAHRDGRVGIAHRPEADAS